MQIYKFLLSTLIFFMILFPACENKAPKTLPEFLEGTWRYTKITGDIKPEDKNYECQLEIKSTGEVTSISVDKNSNPPSIIKEEGKIEGEYIMFGNNNGVKFKYNNGQLEINRLDKNVTIIFSKISNLSTIK